MSDSGSIRYTVHVIAVCSTVLMLTACSERPSSAPQTVAAPKVVLIIGDGMDDQQITIARNYLVGNGGRLTLDELPFRGAAQVQTITDDGADRPVYVADSANTATSMATGVVTSTGRIATTAGSDDDIATIMELAHAAGLGTGIVTTSSLTDATPAAFVAHVNQRFCQGPQGMLQTFGPMQMSIDCSQDYKMNGGLGSIAEQIAASDVDIVLGGGARFFDQPVEGSPDSVVTEAAQASGYSVIRHPEGIEGLDGNERVLGLFSPGTMPVRMRGVDGAQAELVEKLDGQVRLPEAFGCEPNPEFSNVPTLAEMTRAALEHLDGERGFMLMIESSSIDKQSHLRRPCGSIGELAQLDEALMLALEYSQAHPETLILVTADHTHAAQIVSETGGFLAMNYASPGHYARVRTPEGSVMGINYATNDSPLQEYHTGGQVPVFADGPGIDALPAFMRQAEIFGVMTRHLGLEGRDAD